MNERDFSLEGIGGERRKNIPQPQHLKKWSREPQRAHMAPGPCDAEELTSSKRTPQFTSPSLFIRCLVQLISI